MSPCVYIFTTLTGAAKHLLIRLRLQNTPTALMVRPPNECPGYGTKQSDGEVPVMLKLWGIQSTYFHIAPRSTLAWSDRILSMGQIELNCVLMLNCIA